MAPEPEGCHRGGPWGAGGDAGRYTGPDVQKEMIYNQTTVWSPVSGRRALPKKPAPDWIPPAPSVCGRQEAGTMPGRPAQPDRHKCRNGQDLKSGPFLWEGSRETSGNRKEFKEEMRNEMDD